MPSRLNYTEDKNNIGIITFERGDRGHNVVDKVFLEELNQCLNDIEENKGLNGLIFQSSMEGFSAGYDIEELHRLGSTEQARAASWYMNDTMNRIACLRMPTACIIHGICLGPGLELALACRWRLVSDCGSTSLGLPEIQLGLIPGAGGTRRLPATVGLQSAIDMILTGRRVSARKSCKIGLTDACVPFSLIQGEAVSYVLKKPASSRLAIISPNPGNLGRELPKWAIEGNPIGRKVMFRKSRDLIDEKTRGLYPASYKALDAVFEGYNLTDKESSEHESMLFGELIRTRQSQSLMHLFRAQEHAIQQPFADVLRNKPGSQRLQIIGVIGAGLMGSGISALCADTNLRVRIADINEQAIGRSLKYAQTWLFRQVDRRSLKLFELQRKMARISPSLPKEGMADVDLVIETANEDCLLKQKLAGEITHAGHPGLIFASNTSAIPITKIAEGAKYPDQVIGMHFFAPVEKMPLLELIVTEKTAPWVIERCLQFGQALNKKAILIKDSPGFYTTRVLAHYLSEAIAIIATGTSIERVDQALIQFGFSQGPLSLIDEMGLNTFIPIINTMAESFPDKVNRSAGLEKIYQSGRLGCRNGGGFYLYTDGKRGASSPEAAKLLGAEAGRMSELPADEITERCLMLFVNESVSCLEEGVLAKASDGDLGAVYGLGFPPFWGGPFKYVDFLGAHHVVEVLNRLSEKYGSRFEPAQLLKEYAAKGKKFFPGEPWQYARN